LRGDEFLVHRLNCLSELAQNGRSSSSTRKKVAPEPAFQAGLGWALDKNAKGKQTPDREATQQPKAIHKNDRLRLDKLSATKPAMRCVVVARDASGTPFEKVSEHGFKLRPIDGIGPIEIQRVAASGWEMRAVAIKVIEGDPGAFRAEQGLKLFSKPGLA